MRLYSSITIYFLDAAFLPYRQMSYFVQTRFPRWFGVSRTFRQDYLGTGFDTTYSFYLPSKKLVNRDAVMPVDRLVAGSREIIKNNGGAWHEPSAWDALNNPLETEYTSRLAEMSRKHGVEVVFIRLPFFNSPPRMFDEAFYRSLDPLLDAEQLADNPRYYSDPGHFNRNGIDQTSDWLWHSITPYLHPLDNNGLPEIEATRAEMIAAMHASGRQHTPTNSKTDRRVRSSAIDPKDLLPIPSLMEMSIRAFD